MNIKGHKRKDHESLGTFILTENIWFTYYDVTFHNTNSKTRISSSLMDSRRTPKLTHTQTQFHLLWFHIHIYFILIINYVQFCWSDRDVKQQQEKQREVVIRQRCSFVGFRVQGRRGTCRPLQVHSGMYPEGMSEEEGGESPHVRVIISVERQREEIMCQWEKSVNSLSSCDIFSFYIWGSLPWSLVSVVIATKQQLCDHVLLSWTLSIPESEEDIFFIVNCNCDHFHEVKAQSLCFNVGIILEK